MTNYKLIDGILLELPRKLKVQEQQKVLADAWKPYMKNLDTIYTFVVKATEVLISLEKGEKICNSRWKNK